MNRDRDEMGEIERFVAISVGSDETGWTHEVHDNEREQGASRVWRCPNDDDEGGAEASEIARLLNAALTPSPLSGDAGELVERIDRRLLSIEQTYPGTNRRFADRDGEWSMASVRADIRALEAEKARLTAGFNAAVENRDYANRRKEAFEAELAQLRAAGEGVINRMFSTYKARNGREVGIQGDDGEKCWIVHSDDIEGLRAALAPSAAETGEGEAR